MPPINGKREKKVMIVAGEASGDLHGAALVRAMINLDSGIRFIGVGGNQMKAAGVELIADSSHMAVVGFTEVFSRLGYILKTMMKLKAMMKAKRPDLLILIDYPDFNFPLARAAHKLGVKVFYYISPQLWAWRKGRIKTIKKNVDKMAVILPFEVEFYKSFGVNVYFVGHPLLDAVKTKCRREEAMQKFCLQDNLTTLALLPGSRKAEVDRLLPEMLKAAIIIKRQFPTLQIVLPLADTLDMEFVYHIVQQHDTEVKIVREDRYDLVAISDLAIVTSGTATLETALLEVPMVIIYKLSALTYWIGKMLVHGTHIGMANIIAGKTVAPELIQDNANAVSIAAEAINILTNKEKMHTIKYELSKIREKLGQPGAANRAAGIAHEMMV